MVPSVVVQAAHKLVRQSLRLLTGLAAVALAVVAGVGPIATAASAIPANPGGAVVAGRATTPGSVDRAASDRAASDRAASDRGSASSAITAAGQAADASTQADPTAGNAVAGHPLAEPVQSVAGATAAGESERHGIAIAGPAGPRAPPFR